MLTSKCIWTYREQFNNEDCFFAEPGNNIIIINPDTKKTYISPEEETEIIFMDRINRCKQEHRNLFFEEWDEFVTGVDVFYWHLVYTQKDFYIGYCQWAEALAEIEVLISRKEKISKEAQELYDKYMRR